MHLDVRDIHRFYYHTRLGRAAQKAVRDQILARWPEARGQTVVGFGFAVPLLRPYLPDARRVIALMPGQQGVAPWPQGGANVSVLCRETLWPLETGSVDRLVMLHGLETSDSPPELLAEAWRCLGPGGKMLVVVPNRAGLWARDDRTPFGFGRPYTAGQLADQLKANGFRPGSSGAALFQPPTERRFWRRWGATWERAGRSVFTNFAGGVLLVEATKQVPAPMRPNAPVTERRSVFMPELGTARAGSKG